MSDPISESLGRYFNFQPANFLVIKEWTDIDYNFQFKKFLINRKFEVRELMDREIKKEMNKYKLVYPKKLNKKKDNLIKKMIIKLNVEFQYYNKFYNWVSKGEREETWRIFELSHENKKLEFKPKNLVIDWVNQVTSKMNFRWLLIINYYFFLGSNNHLTKYKIIEKKDDLREIVIHELEKKENYEKLYINYNEVDASELLESTLNELKENHLTSYHIINEDYWSQSRKKIKLTYRLVEITF